MFPTNKHSLHITAHESHETKLTPASIIIHNCILL